MYIFHLGIISTLLSDPLVNSFTTGAAVCVLISQIKDLLGLKIPKQKGYFKFIFVSIKFKKNKLIRDIQFKLNDKFISDIDRYFKRNTKYKFNCCIYIINNYYWSYK